MNKSYQYKQQCEIAKEKGIQVKKINEPKYRFKCAILKDNIGYMIVLNLPLFKNIAMKAKALKWAVECCIDETKTDWRDLNVIPTDDTNRP